MFYLVLYHRHIVYVICWNKRVLFQFTASDMFLYNVIEMVVKMFCNYSEVSDSLLSGTILIIDLSDICLIP